MCVGVYNSVCLCAGRCMCMALKMKENIITLKQNTVDNAKAKIIKNFRFYVIYGLVIYLKSYL